MTELFLARLQFGLTTVYHFFFVPLTLGLVLFLAIMETAWVRTRNPVYKDLTKYWGKLFIINFAVGVATGIVQEFQFGMNWSEYSRMVGDIFGVPLAIEALLAFFLESTFLGLWIFGWERLSPRIHALCIWLVVIGSWASAFWILVANSFMQEPTGFVIRNGRAEMTDFAAIVFNPHAWYQFSHTLVAGIATAGFFVVGISAWTALRNRISFTKGNTEPDNGTTIFIKRSLALGVTFALVGSLLVAWTGHTQAQHMVQAQPMKMAAAEALWESANPAPLSLISIFDEKEQRDLFSIKIPYGLSLLSFNSLAGEVKGIRNLQEEFTQKYGPGDWVPSVFACYWSFRTMVGTGFAMIGIALLALLLLRGKPFISESFTLRLCILGLFLPYLANSAGWLLTELGRQPWVVYGILRTDMGLSPQVSIPMLLFSLLSFGLLYAILIVVDVWLLARHARRVPTTN